MILVPVSLAFEVQRRHLYNFLNINKEYINGFSSLFMYRFLLKNWSLNEKYKYIISTCWKHDLLMGYIPFNFHIVRKKVNKKRNIRYFRDNLYNSGPTNFYKTISSDILFWIMHTILILLSVKVRCDTVKTF